MIHATAEQPEANLPTGHDLNQPVEHHEVTPSTQEESAVEEYATELSHKLHLYIPKAIAIVLAAQGLYSMYHSINFILVEFPMMETELAAGLIEQETITMLANKAVLDIFKTIISFFFALRLSLVHTKIAKQIHTAIGVILILGNTQFNMLIERLGGDKLITQIVSEFFVDIFQLF